MKGTTRILLLFLPAMFMLALMLHSCKKDNATPPHNPYDDIVRGDSSVNNIPLDSLTIAYIHKKVLSTRCALNGCHDGHFEPDFRTPQSAFSSLVYQAPIKNDTLHPYKFRVYPFDTTHSVMYQRITSCCFITPNDRMPQDNIGVPLPDSSIHLIARWIMTGARDISGNIARLPNQEPVIPGYITLNTSYQTAYVNNRLGGVSYNPFIVPDTVTQFYFATAPTDDSTPISQFQYNKLKISLKENDFSNAWEFPAQFINAGNAQIWLATINTAQLPTNDTLFMRYYVNDGSHTSNTEFPRNDLLFVYKYYWSFIRQ